jgi:hypothetical protein
VDVDVDVDVERGPKSGTALTACPNPAGGAFLLPFHPLRTFFRKLVTFKVYLF